MLTNNKLFVIVVGVLLLIGLGLLLYPHMEIQPQETNPIATPKDIALQGTYLCLPHKDISGPQTLECALVIKTDDDAYYALDLNQLSEFPAHISMGERISVQGIMIPIEQLSSDHWQKYPITGIFTVTDPIN